VDLLIVFRNRFNVCVPAIFPTDLLNSFLGHRSDKLFTILTVVVDAEAGSKGIVSWSH